MPLYEQASNAGGLDRRFGAYARKDTGAFWDLDNAYIDAGGQVARRPPIKSAGAFDANSFGLFPINGVLNTLAARGSSPTLPAGVVALYFDVPFGATAHVLKDVVNLGDTIVALIAHTISGAVRYFLHVFDGAADLPTYVTDSTFPWMHEIDPTVVPAMTAAASKVWISDKYGDVYHSAVNRPRVWNTFTRDQILAHGHEFHLYCPAAGAYSFTIPLDYAQIDAALDAGTRTGFLAWIVQQFTGTGTPDYTIDANWSAPIAEVNAAPAASQCRFQSTANTSSGATYSNWITVTINAAAAGWFRARFLTPRDAVRQVNNYVISGAMSPTQETSVNVYLRGDGATKRVIVKEMIYVDPTHFHQSVVVNGATLANPADYVTVSGQNGALEIDFTAAPADGALIVVTQQYLGFGPGLGTFYVPPGVVDTLWGQRDWSGGIGTFVNVNGIHYLFLALDTNGRPTGMVELAPGGFLTGKLLYESVWLSTVNLPMIGSTVYNIPVYNGVKYPAATIYSSINYAYRGIDADGKLYTAISALFGFADAGFLPTSKDDLSGGPVTLLASTRNRLLVMYARGSLMWTIFVDPTKDVLADTGAIGTDGQLQPQGVDFFGAQMIPTARGLRLADLGGPISSLLDDQNIGGPIDALGFPQFLAGAFWPYLSHYVAAATIGGSFCFLVLSYHKQERVAAWSRYPTPAGITSVDARAMVSLGDKLYFRSGTELYYFKGSVCEALKSSGLQAANTFKDDNDAVGAQYQSVAEPLLNKLGRPGITKRYRRFGITQRGRVSVSFKRISGSAAVYQAGPTIDGDTSGRAKPRLAMRAEAIAPRMVSTDTRGWRVDVFNYEYDHLERA